MAIRILTISLVAVLAMTGCAREQAPTSVDEFVLDRVMLDATLARCDLDQSDTFDDRNCVNARRAVERLWREQEELNTELLERESERKRQMLREQREREDRLAEQRRLDEQESEQQALYQGLDFTATPELSPDSQDDQQTAPLPEDPKPDH
ncbi:MAG: EexN family lipoprotein [Gammaproteobacteria bacterium]|nr:EexN family lipoprotein [Gammaproteobacteria bacterium]